MSPRPGIVKVRRVPHVASTTKLFVRTVDGAIKSWIELADVVSEGETRADASGRSVYYGTSSIVLEWDRAPGARLRDPDLAPALSNDPHLRLRALRIARREAEVRCGGDLSVLRADIATQVTARGIALTIDVEARVSTAVKISRG